MTALPSSAIIWEGPSLFTGRLVQVVLTGLVRRSANAKTGVVVQASIIPAGTNPSVALGTERERDVCGDCPLRGRGAHRACYVATGVWLLGQHLPSYGRVNLDTIASALAGMVLRIGAYGDPAAIPFEVWQQLLSHVRGWTAYTHAWRYCDPRFHSIAMASTETYADSKDAEAMGWRYFRICPPDGAVWGDEVMCPNEQRGLTCADCMLCVGTARRARSVVIPVHGAGKREWLRRFGA